MNLPKLPCAGKLGNCPKTVQRFRSTCLKCRWRKMKYGGWQNPPFWITYAVVWRYPSIVWHNSVFVVHDCIAVIDMGIDPRGWFTAIRCAVIVALMKIAGRMPVRLPNREPKCIRLRKTLVTLCEFFACITIGKKLKS